jgi:hypothetical protein
MSAAPEQQAGVVSSTNTVARTVAGAIGVALLGAVLSSVYTSSFLDGVVNVQGLPDAMRGPASESVGAAVVIAESLPEGMGVSLKRLAHESFMDGWRVLAFISCAVSVLGAGISARFVLPEGRKTSAIPESVALGHE